MVEKHRGVSLLKQDIKVYENTVKRRLRDIMKIDEKQFGFQPTVDAIFILQQLQEKLEANTKDIFLATQWALRRQKVPECFIALVIALYSSARSKIRTQQVRQMSLGKECRRGGSYVTKNCKLDEEITAWIQAASCAIGRLRDRVFNSRDLIVDTKLKVYNQCVTPLMMYRSEIWTLYRHHIKLLRTVQQRHLRSILKIK